MRLAYRLLYNSKWEEDPQHYSINLILAVKNSFPDDWEKDWRNEAFLGSAYDVVLGDDRNYDERYYAYLRALNKATPQPPELLIELADCYDAPGEPTVSDHQAISWLEKSFQIEPYLEAAALLTDIYSRKGDKKRSEYWSKIMEELDAQNKRAPPLEPSFVREGYE